MTRAPTEPLDPTEHVLWLIEYELERGNRDLLGGGIATRTLAAEHERSQSAFADRCRALCEAGDLVQVQGLAPADDGKDADAPRARVSYLPVGHPDAPTDDADERRVRG